MIDGKYRTLGATPPHNCSFYVQELHGLVESPEASVPTAYSGSSFDVDLLSVNWRAIFDDYSSTMTSVQEWPVSLQQAAGAEEVDWCGLHRWHKKF